MDSVRTRQRSPQQVHETEALPQGITADGAIARVLVGEHALGIVLGQGRQEPGPIDEMLTHVNVRVRAF